MRKRFAFAHLVVAEQRINADGFLFAFDDDVAPAEPGRGEQVLAMAQRSEFLLRYGTILAAILAFFFFVARPALSSMASAPTRRAAGESSAVPLRVQAAAEVPRLSPEQREAEERKVRAQNVFEQVAENVKRDPMQSTRLLESWIRSE